MKYLSYFENQTETTGRGKLTTPQVVYIQNVNNANYPNGIVLYFDEKLGDYCEIKTDSNGDPVLEGSLVSGYVDLGLSVMWAECNLGANNPGETGLFYSWGEVEGHELAEDGVSFKDGHLFNENNYQIPDRDIKHTLKLANDAVYQSMLQHPSHDMVRFRMPTFDQYNELIANTTSELSVIDDKPVYVLTSTINGNSITIPIVGGFEASNEGETFHYNSYSYLWGTSNNAGEFISDGSYADVYDYVNHQFLPHGGSVYAGLPIRGVCDNLPSADFLFPGKKYNIVKDKVYAVRCEHGLEIPFTGIVQCSATPDFAEFITIESTDLLQLTPLDLTQYVSNILYSNYSKACTESSFETSLYCYIKFNQDINVQLNYWNTEYLKIPLLYNDLKVRVRSSSTSSSKFPVLRIKYTTIQNKTITVSNPGNYIAYVGVLTSLSHALTSSACPFYTQLKRNASTTLDSTTIASLADYVDENGYIYLGYRGNSSTSTSTLLFQIG